MGLEKGVVGVEGRELKVDEELEASGDFVSLGYE